MEDDGLEFATGCMFAMLLSCFMWVVILGALIYIFGRN